MLRQIISIDEEKCNGCGICVPSCKEGAIQIISGKARLISDLFCDGLGACLGECPEGAITISEREAEPYSERKVLEQLINQPPEVLKAHLAHLISHRAHDFYQEAKAFFKERNIQNPMDAAPSNSSGAGSACGCPGSQARELKKINLGQPAPTGRAQSHLEQWPVQLHLINPNAPYFKNKELAIMSTCAPIASANVHADYLAGRAVVVACPKLDDTEPYTRKLSEIFAINNTPVAIIIRMEVPCCGGLTRFAIDAAKMSGRTGLAVVEHTLSIEGELISKTIVFQS